MIMTQDVQTQTNFLPTCTIDRFYSIYNGGKYGELSKILDILNSGYGWLHTDNSFLSINRNLLFNNCLVLLSLKKELSQQILIKKY